MNFQNSVKRLTVKFVSYTNLTTAERNEKKLAKKKASEQHSIYTNKWFGIIPFAWRSVFKNK